LPAPASVGAERHLTQRWTLLGKFESEFASAVQIYAGSGHAAIFVVSEPG